MTGKHEKTAFTLAEVLITLGIIGVVAAMTLPTLIQKNDERVTVTRVKKYYSVINQALLLAIKDYGTADEWNFTDDSDEGNNTYLSNKFAEYFKPYLKIAKYCGDKEGCLGYTKHVKNLAGNNWINYETEKSYSKMILHDGTTLWFRRDSSVLNTACKGTDEDYSNVCGHIFIDINGKNEPNTIGKDIFSFIVLKNRIMPDNDPCQKNEVGWGCAAYILQNDNMDYLKK